MEQQYPIISFFFTWIALIKGIDWLFDKDELIKDKSRKQLSAWLQKVDFGNEIHRLPTSFTLLFDRIFKKNTNNSFIKSISIERSFFASFFPFLIVTLLLFKPSDMLWDKYDLFSSEYYYKDRFIRTFIIALYINPIADHISLIQTRKLIDQAKIYSSLFVLILFLIIDIILTFIIASICAVIIL